jgi:hypothetical protein
MTDQDDRYDGDQRRNGARRPPARGDEGRGRWPGGEVPRSPRAGDRRFGPPDGEWGPQGRGDEGRGRWPGGEVPRSPAAGDRRFGDDRHDRVPVNDSWGAPPDWVETTRPARQVMQGAPPPNTRWQQPSREAGVGQQMYRQPPLGQQPTDPTTTIAHLRRVPRDGGSQEYAVAGRDARSLRLWGVVWLAAGLGVLVDGVATAISPTHFSLGLTLFWPAAIIPNIVFARVLLSGRLSKALRHTTIAIVGIYSAALYHMSAPIVLGGFDEHLHERTLNDLLFGSGLFAPNPLLDVSPNYPGMELVTGLIIRLTGVSTMVGIFLAVLLFRYMLVLVIYESALTVNKSQRFASLVVLLYATSPQFFFFNSQFAYQSMALPLGLGGLLLIRRAQLSSGAYARLFTVLGIIVLAATVMTHHITGCFVFAFLVVWTLATPKSRRSALSWASLGMGIFLVVWTAAVAGKLNAYLGPLIGETWDEIVGLIGQPHASRQLFNNQAGFVLPEWQRLLLLAYAAFYSVSAVLCGFTVIRRARGRRVMVLVGLLTFAYPVTLAAHALPSAASLGDRASTFLFLPFALSVSLIVMHDPRVMPVVPLRRSYFIDFSKSRTYRLFAVFIGVAYLGGILLGSGPDWSLLPGPYMVVADSRSQDPEMIAAVRWVASHLPPGSVMIADRSSADVLAAEARMWIPLSPEPGAYFASVYFSPTWSSYQTAAVRQMHISYIYVDHRLADGLPQESYYIYSGETPTPERLTTEELSKFSHVPGLKDVYHHGPIDIYSTAGLGVTPQPTGFSGYRHMGFGTARDALLGALVVSFLYVARRRLRWLLSALRSAGAVSCAVVGTAAAAFLGLALFGLLIVPGPGFSIGAGLMTAIWFAVGRLRAGVSLLPHGFRFPRVSWMAVLGILILCVGLAIDYHAAWQLDVGDVNAILQSVRM